MLCAYYNIHTADHFGPLYVGMNPTPSHNKHLDIEKMEASFNKDVNGVLVASLRNTRAELSWNQQFDRHLYNPHLVFHYHYIWKYNGDGVVSLPSLRSPPLSTSYMFWSPSST